MIAYFAFVQYTKTSNLLSTGTRTTATVIDLLEFHDNDGTLYSPVFGFTDRSGTGITFETGVKSRPAAYGIGEKVSVIYDRTNTRNVMVVSFWGLYRWSVILLMIAAPLLVIGGTYLLYVAT